MDYATLPPEVNSARMYTGPGSAAMLAAATAWDGLAVELSTAASNYGSTIADLTGGAWRGPASTSMAAAAAPYVTWMSTTAARATQTAGQARLAAAAYEAAFAMTVPPPLIAANRAQLASLVATNLLGQNTPAIAATEAHYAEMWAHDAAAMYGYAGSSAAATALSPFTGAPATTSGDGAAPAEAAGAQASLSQLMSALPNAIQGLALPGLPGAGWTAGLDDVASWLGLGGADFSTPAGILNFLLGTDGSPLGGAFSSIGLNALSSGFYTPGNFVGTLADALSLQGSGAAAEAAGDAADAAGEAAGAAGSGLGNAVGGLGGAMSAGVGNAASIGPLSVPPAWTAAAEPMGAPAAPLPTAGVGPVPATSGLANTLGGVPLAGPSGRGVSDIPRYGFRPTMVTHPPAAG